MTNITQASTAPSMVRGHDAVRTYDPEVIDSHTLQTLMTAAVGAQNVAYPQPLQFVVIQDRGVLKSLSDRAKAMLVAQSSALGLSLDHLSSFVQPDFNIFYDAGTLLVICARNRSNFALADCWLAEENLVLAAQSIGLGTCAIGLAISVLNLPEVKQELGIAKELAPVAPIIIGKPRRVTPYRVKSALRPVGRSAWTVRRRAGVPWTLPERRANPEGTHPN
ncbi:MAG: nitroreductase family protein [Rhodoferax sp.]|nr:nitroreductase family protein [Rhodoferax sp.]